MAKALAFSAVVIAASLTGCSPFGGGAFPCTSDLQCNRPGQGGGVCDIASGATEGVCTYPMAPEAGVDVDMAPTEVCFGHPEGLVKPCFPAMPAGTMPLPASIITDDGSPLCSSNVTEANGLCVI